MWDALAPLGIDLDQADASVSDGDTLVATVPTFRPDLEREIDLVEEVARRIGFDHIGRTVPKATGQVGGLTQLQRDRRAVADALVGFGCSEAITLSLVSPAGLERAGAPVDRLVRASNPLRAEESVLRTRVLPGLLQSVAFNRSHGLHDVALFEQGHVFLTPADGAGPLPDEPEHLAMAMAGTVRRRPVEDDRPVDVYDAVDALRAVVDALEIEEFALEPADIAGFRPGRSARALAGGVDVGVVGEVADAVVNALGLERPVVAFEVVLDTLVAAPRRDRQFASLSRFPASSIDLAFAVPDTVPADCHRPHAARTPSERPPRGRASVRRVPVGDARCRAPQHCRSRCGSARPITRSPTPRSPISVSARSTRWSRPTGPSSADKRVFVHHIRPRYAEVDAQGVVFNAHWLTYFDESQTRFFEALGLRPKVAFFTDFDVMVVKAVIEWQGPAGFDDDVAIAVRVPRLGTASFDIEYTATCNDVARVRRRHHVRISGPRDSRLHADSGGDAGEDGRARLIRQWSRSNAPAKSSGGGDRVEPVVVGGEHDRRQGQERVQHDEPAALAVASR